MGDASQASSMKLDELRKLFLKYFESQGHRVVSSSSLVPRHDPTLLFTNAGMVQFKDYFLGVKESEFKTAASAQLCMRAGGKHNDLENVGETGRHLTLFEMLGNFSFGDYFKEKAIHYAWDFVIKALKLPKENLRISVHKKDKETYDIWHKKIGIDKKHIVRHGDEQNFWQMADTGPCGYCTEIYYDWGLKSKGSCGKQTCSVGGCPEDCDRYTEIWNLVFMQYDRSQDGKLLPLPKPSVDTGMGLERIAAVLQGVSSIYDIDLFKSLISKIEQVVGCFYGRGRDNDISIRVIADHIRSISFLIAEGVLPSNEGRGYVLRRIIRRAVRHGKKLGCSRPFLYKLVGPLSELMAKPYPQLKEQKPFIEKVIHAEEERFLETLERGLQLLSAEILKLQKAQKKMIPGETVYKLYDTFGFPLDLIAVIAHEKKLSLDQKGFEKYMEEQRARARAEWKGSGEKKLNPIYQKLAQKIKSGFLGYETTTTKARLEAIIEDGQVVKRLTFAKGTENVELIFDQTPFYGEGGGQVGDTGIIKIGGVEIKIKDTQKPFPDLIVHIVESIKGCPPQGNARLIEEKKTAELSVDVRRRRDIMLNHTATHMLHHALQALLGEHVRQAGSLVAPDRLRFDFTHFSPLTSREIKNIEDFMNERIRLNDPVTATVMSYKEAREVGAIALFGEKYGQTVRVLQIGDYSTELCGGTHLTGTGEIRLFKIISETALGAGVRRLEALTGEGALNFLTGRHETLKEIETDLKSSPKDVVHRVQQLIATSKTLARHQATRRDQDISEKAKALMDKIQIKKGIQILAAVLPEADAGSLRTYCDVLRDRMKSGIVVLGAKVEVPPAGASPAGERALLLAAVTQDLTSKFSAHEIIQKIAPLIGGKGGGKPDLAQGGGPDTHKLSEAILKVYDLYDISPSG